MGSKVPSLLWNKEGDGAVKRRPRGFMGTKATLLTLILTTIIFLLCSCETETHDVHPIPSDIIDETPPPEIVIPSGAPTIKIFGLAYASTGSLNPITCKSRLNLSLIPLMYEGLFEIDERFEAIPVLCESFEQWENSYIIRIKSGIHFSDGTELKARDVKYSLDMARSSNSVYTNRIKHVSGITTLSESEIRIDLTKKIGRFELLLDIPIVKQGSADLSSPIGTGPYVYVEDGEDYFLRSNPNWWRDWSRPYSRIDLINTPEADLLINFFEAGVITMVGNDYTATDPVVFGGDYEEWTFTTSTMYYLGFNAASGPMQNPNLRRAIGYAIDREYICEAEMVRYADPATLPISPQSRLYNEKVADKYRFSLDMMEELLYEAGYSEEKPLEVNIIVNSENAFKLACCERIAEDLRAMGIVVTLQNYKWEDYVAALNRGSFDIYLAEVKLQSDFDMTELISANGSLNFGKYYSENMEELLAQYLAADSDSVEELAPLFYGSLAEEAPIVPILFKRNAVLARRGVISTITPTQSNIYYGMKN